MKNSENKTLVNGIPCLLRKLELREALKNTLQQIQDNCPEDFERVKDLVREIRPYDDAEVGDLGIWIHDEPRQDDQSTWHYGDGDTPGIIKINENIKSSELPAILAHELGHAATQDEDLEQGGPVSDEWQSELAADRYASKWGFEKQLAESRKTRDWLHHTPGPNSTLEESYDGNIYCYEIDQNYIARLIKKTKGSIKL